MPVIQCFGKGFDALPGQAVYQVKVHGLKAAVAKHPIGIGDTLHGLHARDKLLHLGIGILYTE